MKLNLILKLLLLTILSSLPVYSNIKIICSKNIEETTLNTSDLKQIFMGEKRLWSNKQRINIAILVKSKTQKEFHKKYIGKSLTKFVHKWRLLVYKGSAKFPKIFDNCKEMVDYIAKHKNIIGYVKDTTNTDSVNEIIII